MHAICFSDFGRISKGAWTKLFTHASEDSSSLDSPEAEVAFMDEVIFEVGEY